MNREDLLDLTAIALIIAGLISLIGFGVWGLVLSEFRPGLLGDILVFTGVGFILGPLYAFIVLNNPYPLLGIVVSITLFGKGIKLLNQQVMKMK